MEKSSIFAPNHKLQQLSLNYTYYNEKNRGFIEGGIGAQGVALAGIRYKF